MGVLDIISERQLVVPLTNKSGGARSEGDVVIWDTTADDAFTRTATAQDKKVVGVVAETIADDAAGRVIIDGHVAVLAVDAATSRGDYLYASTTDGKATPSSTLVQGVFGIALSAVASAGNISALIWSVAPPSPVGYIILYAKNGWPRIMNGCSPPGVVYLGPANKICMTIMRFDQYFGEYAQWTTIMPDDWDGGAVTARAYYTSADGAPNEKVQWEISGRSHGDGDAIDQASGTAVVIPLESWLGNLDLVITAASGAITLAGTPTAGEFVHWELTRTSVSPLDNLDCDAMLLAVLLTYIRAFSITGP